MIPDPDVIAAIQEEDSKAAYLERLYWDDARDFSSHPFHGLYTGLIQERAAYLLEQDRRKVTGRTGA